MQDLFYWDLPLPPPEGDSRFFKSGWIQFILLNKTNIFRLQISLKGKSYPPLEGAGGGKATSLPTPSSVH